MMAVQVEGVTRSFDAVQVLRGVDLTVTPGQLVALYGPSGSGKTTLLNLIGALDTPTSGHIWVNEKPVSRLSASARALVRRKQIGFIFQTDTLLPTYSARENIDLALRLTGLGYFKRRERTRAALEAVGLSAWRDHLPDELSGGQRRRVAIARALAVQSRLILADEPTSGLDTHTVRRVLGLFRGIAATQNTAFIIVSHDPLVETFVDCAYDLFEGQLIARQKPQEQPI